jgi:plastocyanin
MTPTTIFYILGLGLVGVALIVSAIGLRVEGFPSPRAMKLGLPPFAALVLATMVFAVLNSRHEHEHTEENRHAAQELQEIDHTQAVEDSDDPDNENEPGAQSAAPTPEQDTAAGAEGGAAQILAVSSPDSGALEFDPTDLTAKAGAVEIDYDNPSPVPHNIALEDSAGEVLDESETGTEETFSISADVQPGDYTFFCSVPGHRESGMEGKLVVK